MLTNSQIEQFEKVGFIKGNVKLSEEEVNNLRNEMQLVLEGKTTKKPLMVNNLAANSNKKNNEDKELNQIFNIWMASDMFFNVAKHKDICTEVSQLCGSNTIKMHHDQIQYKPPLKGGTTPWHQDYGSWQHIEPANLVTAWIALDDVEIENGCMWMVPGSHKWGIQQEYIGVDEEFVPYHKQPNLLPTDIKIESVPIILKKGEINYHHCLTWHGSPDNNSLNGRRGYAIHYINGHSRYFPKEKRHPSEAFINVKQGEYITGEFFPIVYGK